MNKVKKKTKKYIGGSNNKKSKILKASTYESKSKCSLEKIVLNNKKCGLMRDGVFGYGKEAGSKCSLNNLKDTMKFYSFFNSEKNKNFVENFLKKITLAYVKKDQSKLENILVILDCLPDIKLLHTPFYKIYKFDSSNDTDEFNEYLKLKNKKKDPKILELGNNTDAILESFKKEVTDISIEILVDFIIEVIIESIFRYENIQKKDVKLDFKRKFENFLTNIENNDNLSYIRSKGIIMTHYIELRNLYFKTEVESGSKEQKNYISNQYINKKAVLKKNLINHLKKEDTKQIINTLQSKILLDKEDKGQKLVETIFNEKRSSSYLFFVLGMLIFALLTKFNVLSGAPLQSSGTI